MEISGGKICLGLGLAALTGAALNARSEEKLRRYEKDREDRKQLRDEIRNLRRDQEEIERRLKGSSNP